MSDDPPRLQLAAVNGEQTIPVAEIRENSFPESLRMFADRVESGEIEATSAIAIMEVDGCVKIACLACDPTLLEAVGLIELAKARVILGCYHERP